MVGDGRANCRRASWTMSGQQAERLVRVGRERVGIRARLELFFAVANEDAVTMIPGPTNMTSDPTSVLPLALCCSSGSSSAHSRLHETNFELSRLLSSLPGPAREEDKRCRRGIGDQFHMFDALFAWRIFRRARLPDGGVSDAVMGRGKGQALGDPRVNGGHRVPGQVQQRLLRVGSWRRRTE